ncbi:DUF2827 domain-containing protein [Paraburkholderia susongensis]|uniref:DUF2827 domain-containing protein n=1 Tax=Paraburkholderia susongensis TaxID=1515439 RepID=A0A1X7M6Z1_9BURK|nr:DUF2827 domain-containing protein [Paraburkholderia susongensis]SMG61149.1 Protein of unknown function [Paraburkholderia susongensis]
MNGLRVGITIGLHHVAETLWNNGIKQNAAFLADALRHCPQVSGVALINTTDIPITPALPWDLARYPTVTFDEAKDSVNIIIELGGQISAEQTAYLKQRDVRLISYCCGSEYILAMESIIFGRKLWGSNLFINQRYDGIWMIPQIANMSQSYFETLRRQAAQIVPFVWSPTFLSERVKDLPNAGEYQRRVGAKRLGVMEPNIDVVKFCLYPALIAELAYRKRPDDIEILQVTNAESIAKESLEFITLLNQLDIVRNHKAVFLGRYDTPTFLAENVDIVISHQLENPLNYFYLEVCWQGYPLVHNASLCADLGYYYRGNDATEGASRVIEVIETHDAHASWYRERQRALLDRHLPDNEQLVGAYAALLDDLMTRPVR